MRQARFPGIGPLREAALAATRKTLATFLSLWPDPTSDQLACLAPITRLLANRLSALDHGEEALRASRCSVLIFRRLVREQPGLRWDLALALNDLSVILDLLGLAVTVAKSSGSGIRLVLELRDGSWRSRQERALEGEPFTYFAGLITEIERLEAREPTVRESNEERLISIGTRLARDLFAEPFSPGSSCVPGTRMTIALRERF